MNLAESTFAFFSEIANVRTQEGKGKVMYMEGCNVLWDNADGKADAMENTKSCVSTLHSLNLTMWVCDEGSRLEKFFDKKYYCKNHRTQRQ